MDSEKGSQIVLSVDADFDRWWLEIPGPMKKKKARAKGYWVKIWCSWAKRYRVPPTSPTGGVLAVLQEAIQRQVEAGHFRISSGRDAYPYASTWLNDRRWEDEAPEAPSLFDKAADTGTGICPECNIGHGFHRYACSRRDYP